MTENAKRIAIIPARSGSVRIPHKNIKVFCGRPMISYTLEIAKNTKLFDVIHVSTDSETVAKICEGLGYQIDFLRPKELADHTTPILPVLKYVLNTYREQGRIFDELCLLMPCSPLLKSEDLCSAYELYQKFGGKRSVLSITKYPAPIEWAFNREDDGTLIPVSHGAFSIRSQDLNTRYYDAGAFDYMSANRVLSPSVEDLVDSYVGYVLPPERAIDIDEPEDWKLAEKLFSLNQSF